MRWIPAVTLLAASAGCGPDDTAGACKDNLIAGDLVVTEVFADYAAPAGGAGTDDGKEWFEIYNNADRPVSLKGVTITASKQDGSTPKSHALDDITIAPGQFFTLGNATSDLIPAYVDYGYSADLGEFSNSTGGKLVVKCGDSEIDSAVFDGVKSGRSRQLSNAGPPDYTLNDDQVNWCEANDTEFEQGNFGTPGQDNDCAPIVMGACSDGGAMRQVVSPAAGDLVVTEVMPGPAGDDNLQEWFEAKASRTFDLNGLGLDRAGDTSAPNVIESPICISVSAGSYVIFGKQLDMTMNGGLPAGSVLGTFSFSLVSGSVTTPGDLQIVLGATIIDAISWTRSTTGKSLGLDPDLTDAIANDSPSNFCDGTVTYGAGGMGTPGAINGQCTLLPPAGMCMDGVSLRAIVPPVSPNLVITEVMPNPKIEPSQEWFEITNVGSTAFDINGLGLDRAGDTGAPSVVSSATCKSLAPGGYALFAKSSDVATNGGLPAVDGTFALSMINTSGEVQVVDPTSCTGSPSVCTTIYDTATWTTTADGLSEQLSPTACRAVAGQTYGTGGNAGTPRLANVCM